MPLRTEPSRASEMGSQILFGETFRILEGGKEWLRVALEFDSSEGWLEKDSIHMVDETAGTGTGAEVGPRLVVRPSIAVVDMDQGHQMILPAGSVWVGSAGLTTTIYGRHFELLSEEGLMIPGKENDPEEIGKWLLSIPGLHGGRCGFGFDGPGLVQMICRTMGRTIPRDCRGQAGEGSNIHLLHEARKGDLAFFDEGGELIHVGMVLGGGMILHAADQVRIDRLDHQGIFNAEKQVYTHRLRIIKRI